MRRRHRHDDHQNHEAWAIPYADLLTLLLAFFVVMYAVSVVNEGKFRVMSDSMVQAFTGSSQVIAPMPPTQVRPLNIEPAIATPDSRPGAATAPVVAPQRASAKPDLKAIENQVRTALKPLIDSRQVIVRNKKDRLEIEIRTDILFSSGVAQLSTPAQGVLSNLAEVLAGYDNQLRIEGFTDDVPISNAVFPSNWELSAARAGSVARLFVADGIDQQRIGIVGWGEMRPVADNATAEGRNQNRRVLVIVMGEAGSEPPREQRALDRLPAPAPALDGLLPARAEVPAPAGPGGVP